MEDHSLANLNYTVLIVDDEPMVTTSISDLLKLETQYQVVTYNDPMEALTFVESDPVDLVISDFIMPKMNGLEFLKLVKEINPDITSIILTGYADKENSIRAINELQIYHYIEKPWDNDELILVIKNGLEKRNLIFELREKINELDQINRELKETQDELVKQEKNAAIGSMASRIIHDLKTPMSVIHGYNELIATIAEDLDEEKAQKIKSFTQFIANEIKRLVGMIQEILNFVRGEESLDKIPLPIKDVIEEALDISKLGLEQQNIKIFTELEANETMLIDHQRFIRMLNNIINNSRDALTEGGKIWVFLKKYKGKLHIQIKDNGIGIPEEIIDKVFEPFVSYGKSGGTGLGLAIAKKIVESHRGVISINSQPNEGTITNIYFTSDIN